MELFYDPDEAPDPKQWLAATEVQRLDAVRGGEGDELRRMDSEQSDVHVALHATVETQVAMNDPPEVGRTLQRLIDQGMSRHGAIHAIGFVVIATLNEMVNQKREYDERQYVAKLADLHADNVAEAAGGLPRTPEGAPYAAVIGPVPTHEGDVFHALLCERSKITQAVVEKTAKRALRKLLKKGRGKGVWCDPEVAELTEGLEVSFGIPYEDAAVAHAFMSSAMLHGNRARPEDGFQEAFEAALDFACAEPWQWYGNSDVLQVTATRAGETRTFEAGIMGAAGMEYGLGLYPPGQLRAILDEQRRPSEALSVSFEEVQYGGDGFFENWGLPAVPRFVWLRGDPQRLDRAFFELLTATLRAAVQLTDKVRRAQGECGETTVELAAAPPPRTLKLVH